VCAPEPKINGPSADRNQLYGRYEVRFRADATDGYKLAWLLWPKSGVWPRDAEIDFPEGDLVGSIGVFMHRQNGTAGNDQDPYKTTAKFSDWHTAVIEWKPNFCRFILDGNIIGTSTSRVPNTPMHWVLHSETELNSTYPAASAVANVQIDYVRVWKYVRRRIGCPTTRSQKRHRIPVARPINAGTAPISSWSTSRFTRRLRKTLGTSERHSSRLRRRARRGRA
jgi:beta-glucanase (GH16 family)